MTGAAETPDYPRGRLRPSRAGRAGPRAATSRSHSRATSAPAPRRGSLRRAMIVIVVVMLAPLVHVRRRRRAALAVHPPRVAAPIVLLLPDRKPVLHFIDDIAAGAKGLVAMRRAY